MSLRAITLLNVLFLAGTPLMILLRPEMVLLGAAGALLLGACAAKLRGRAREREREARRVRKHAEEMAAYGALNVSLDGSVEQERLRCPEPLSITRDPTRSLATARGRRVCRAIADHSAFGRAMFLQRTPDGRLWCAGSVGVDALTVAAVERWGEMVVADEVEQEERRAPGSAWRTPVAVERQPLVEMPPPGSLAGRSGGTRVAIRLGEWSDFDPEVGTWELSGRVERRQWRRAMVFPIRARAASGLRTGRLAGAIVICQDGLSQRERDGDVRIDRLIGPLEMLACRLGQEAEGEAMRAAGYAPVYAKA